MLRAFLSILFFGLLLSAFCEPVQPERAATLGLNFWKMRAVGIISEDPSHSQIIRTYSLPEGGEPLYYVFDVTPKGFVIVSAEDAALPVIGYSFEGFYRADDQPDAFREWMQNYEIQIAYAREHTIQADAATHAEWEYFSDITNMTEAKQNAKGVNPLLTTRWDQGSGYNYMCPPHQAGPGGRCYAGCVATAMAQVMKFWNWPVQGVGSNAYYHPHYGTISEDFSLTTYNWSGMTNTLNSSSREPISTLIYHCGVAVDMYYSPLGSASTTYLSMLAMKNHFYYRPSIRYIQRADYTLYEWRKIIMEELDDGKPVLYSGAGNAGGHEWVCDGYQDTNRFHMNWGWGGYNNGYFALTNLVAGSSNFNSGQSAVVNILPYFAPYCLPQKVLTDVSRHFGDGSGGSYYWNDTHCNWLIQPVNATQIVLHFTQFKTEAGKDILSIYDGTEPSAPLIGSFSGHTLPPLITSAGGSLYLVFITDETNQDKGWEASYTATVVGVQEADAVSGFALFPNPASDKLTLSANREIQGNMDIRIYDITGQLKLTQHFPQGRDETGIDISALKSGIYCLVLSSNSGTSSYTFAVQ
jgi:hypothetical protein